MNNKIAPKRVLKNTSTAVQQRSWPDVLLDRHRYLHQHQPAEHNQLALLKELQQQVRSGSGLIDQMYAYVDPASAIDWLNVATHTQYTNFMSYAGGFPVGWAAQTIKHQLKDMKLGNARFLEIIALACGDGVKECQLVENLVEVLPQMEGFPFYLFDINTALLDTAYKHARNLFRDEPRVAPMSVLGDMHEMNMYKEIFFTKEQQSTPRLIILIGATIGNLTDEIAFLQHSLSNFSPGTLLLMDYCLTVCSADNLTEVIQKEPYLSNTFPTKWFKAMERFCLGPIRRYTEQPIKSMVFRPTLEMHRARVPGSYHIELYGDINLEDGTTQTFGVQRIKRYDSEKFITSIEATGWSAISGNRFGPNREMYLFCKK